MSDERKTVAFHSSLITLYSSLVYFFTIRYEVEAAPG